MVKAHSQYVCQQCGYSQVGWSGKCPNCGEWNTLVETVVSTESQKSKRKSQNHNSKPKNLNEIKLGKDIRISTKITELDRVLGGGIVPGQVVLLAGEPGIGKSTILLQVAQNLSSLGKNQFLYVSGEESASQIKIRADRLKIKGLSIQLLESTDVDSIVDTIYTLQGTPLKGVVVDSIQTMQTTDLSGMAGSVGQVRECAYRFVRVAKSTGIPVIIVGHVTKQGSVAGPNVLMHIVDTVLWFEGQKDLTVRILHSRKNRFGSTDEVGIFEMGERGIVPLDNPEKLFITGTKAIPGSILASVLHGTRPILIEVQTLVTPTKMAYPRRVAQGFDSKKLELLIAILYKRCGVALYDKDVFLNIAGGFTVREPSVDLAVVLSLASSYFDKPLAKGLVAIGEVGLSGEIREVIGEARRIKETKRMGYKNIVSSKEVKYLSQAIKRYLR
ncbi:DNA repair protein RadA [Candidatus Woesebacteria bacterium GWB1_43_5]|uniref:DNA repair protein RadA n=1 Tax=Candidatus Woesebacteria bacterium GWB1_43_5 TaxID=1802474 RepID=A0A1F7WTP7_9BACT|nr:MAG: DNA repair protein RadA [Candidatus Woesebacteria bacterium GWB1_43_5]